MRHFFFFIGLLLLSHITLAQQVKTEKRVDYHAENISLKKALSEISELFSVQFFYSSSRIKINEPVSVNITSATLDDIMIMISRQVKIKYKLNNDRIVLFPAEKTDNPEMYSFSGFVCDSVTGERLIGANIVFGDIFKGTMSNSFGYFTYSVPSGKYEIYLSFVGYRTKKICIDLSKDTSLYLLLSPEKIELQQVEFRGGKVEKISSVRLGTDELPLNLLRRQPSLMGENDIIQGLKMLPGIQSNTDGFNGLFVRGGTPQQTSFILDDSPLFNIYHISGWFSSVNPDAVKEVNIYKSHLPSKTGGSVSSIIDIRLRDGNNQHFGFSGGIGTLTSRLTVEGPIVKNKASFILSGRRSYIDQIISLFSAGENPEQFYFYDCNGKINYSFNRNNRLFLSAYLSNDMIMDSGGISWGNKVYSLRWNHIFSDNLFSNLTLSGSNMMHRFYEYIEGRNDQLNTGIDYYSLKYDFTLYSLENNKLNFGLNTYLQEIQPLQNNNSEIQLNSILRENHSQQRIIGNIYSEGEFNIGEKITLEGGLRFTLVNHLTSGHTEFHPEPLFSLLYKAKTAISLKTSYSRNYQYDHGASIFELLIPFDRLMFSDKNLKAQFADHFSAGFFSHIPEYSLEISIEPFLSLMKNQYRFISPNDILIGKNYFKTAVSGSTDIYGLEFSLRRTSGKLTGMVNYTWTKILKQEIENERVQSFNPFYERRHDITVGCSYELNKKLNFSASWVYMSGNPYNQPYSKYEIRGVQIPYYSDERYNLRMPSYHRLDAGLKYNFGKHEKFRQSLSLSVYNIYSRTNTLFYFYTDETGFRMHQFYVFRFFPSFSYEFMFN